MRMFALKLKNGNVSITQMLVDSIEDEISKLRENFTGEEEIVSYREISSNDLPSDRVFRNAWTDDLPGQGVDIDPSKAREIIRTKRNKSLSSLDTKALEESRKPNGQLDQIDLRAGELRDLPTTADFKSDDIVRLKRALDAAGV